MKFPDFFNFLLFFFFFLALARLVRARRCLARLRASSARARARQKRALHRRHIEPTSVALRGALLLYAAQKRRRLRPAAAHYNAGADVLVFKVRNEIRRAAPKSSVEHTPQRLHGVRSVTAIARRDAQYCSIKTALHPSPRVDLCSCAMRNAQRRAT